MKNLILSAGFAAWIALTLSCAGTPAPSVIAYTQSAERPVPVQTLVWVGTGKSEVWKDGQWVRTPDQDYEFLVRQNRFADHWESLKVQNRTSPGYNGVAGPSDQQSSFQIFYREPDAQGRRAVTLKSTFGDGSGWADEGYRHALLEFDARGVSSMAPYNRFRITQEYRYEEGRLSELVELFKLDHGVETAFARIHEEARIYR